MWDFNVNSNLRLTDSDYIKMIQFEVERVQWLLSVKTATNLRA
jgi:hypothetical protein